jgi:internalin A
MARMSAADRAYQAALNAIADTIKAGAVGLNYDAKPFRALNRIPPEVRNIPNLDRLFLDRTAITDLSPLQGMTGLKRLFLSRTAITDLSPLLSITELQELFLSRTAITDFSPLQGMNGLRGLQLDHTAITDLLPLRGMTGLQTLSLDRTAITDLSPLRGMTGLQTLSLNRTAITDLSPLQGLTKLQSLSLIDTTVRDLRLLTRMEALGTGAYGGLRFAGTPSVAQDPTLRRLSEIHGDQQRARDTIAYLKTLPPWPEPLPWDVAAPPPPDAAVPLRSGDDGISLATAPITDTELDDPIRATLHAALQDQVTDLVRVSANIDDATYRQACKLRDLLDSGLAIMDPLLVHLAIEALRRIKAKTLPDTDRDYLLALEVVIDTGPGLTLDTQQVQLFIDRAKRNRLDRLAEVETDAQIRLAQSIADSDLTAPDLQKIAALAADDTAQDQFTAIRPTLALNYVIAAGLYLVGQVFAGPLGQIGTEATTWLAANASDISTMAVVWGEPFAAWIAPILDRAQQMADGVKHIASKLRNRK